MKKTLLKRLTSVTLATALIGTMGVAAFAEGKADVAASSYLIKYLEVGEGITVPNETFTFTFTQTKYNGADVTDTYKADIAAVTMTTNSGTWDKTNDADDEASIYQKKSMADILANTTFPAAGVYTYTVAETAGNTAGFTYDGQTYVLNVYVTNEGKKTIEVKKEGTGDKEGEKVDVTKTDPTKDAEETTGDNSVTVQGFTFDNKYAKTNTKTDDNTEGFLNISKTVVGDYGDKTYGFEFAITLTAPRLAAKDAVAKYSIYNADGTKAVDGATMEYGKAVEFNLADGQTLRFYEIEAGTKYSVTEKLSTSGVTKAAEYKASAVATNKGTAVTVPTVEKHTDLTVETYVIDDSTDTKDDVDYTNTFDDTSVSPTGILINNAPYIILALVAAGGMTFYVVKKRKEN